MTSAHGGSSGSRGTGGSGSRGSGSSAGRGTGATSGGRGSSFGSGSRGHSGSTGSGRGGSGSSSGGGRGSGGFPAAGGGGSDPVGDVGNWFNPGTGHRQDTGSSSGSGRPAQGSSDTGQTCFVVSHDYHPSAQGDHMIRVVSPQNVYAEAVGVPGAKLEIRRPDAATQGDGNASQSGSTQGDVLRSGSGQGSDTSNAAAAEQGDVQGSGHDQTGQRDGLNADPAADGATGGSQLNDDGPLTVRPQDRIGLRAVVVFPGGETDEGDPINEDERDVTEQAEFSSNAPTVVSVNNTTGNSRGEIRAKTEATATITARYSGLRAQRKVSVAGQHATALHIQPATGETTVKVGGTLPLEATVQYDSGKSEQVTDRVIWRSSDESVASVDSHGVVEGHAVGTAKITGSYKSKDGKSMTDAVEPQVTPDNTGAVTPDNTGAVTPDNTGAQGEGEQQNTPGNEGQDVNDQNPGPDAASQGQGDAQTPDPSGTGSNDGEPSVPTGAGAQGGSDEANQQSGNQEPEQSTNSNQAEGTQAE